MAKGQIGRIFNRITNSRPVKQEWFWLLGQMGQCRGMILSVTALGLVSAVLKVFSTVVSKYLIDALAERNDTMLYAAAVAMGVLLLGGMGLQTLSSRLGAKLHIRTQNRLQRRLYNKLLRTSWQSLDQYPSGDLLNRLNSDIGIVANGVIGLLPGMAVAGIRLLCVVVILFSFDPVVAALALVGTPLSLLISRLLLKTLRKHDVNIKNLGSKALAFQENSLTNLTAIKALDVAAGCREKMEDLQEEYSRVYLSYQSFRIGMTVCLSALNLSVTGLCLGWGVYQLWLGTMSYGSLVLLLQLASMLRGALSGLVSQLQQRVTVLTSVGRVMELEELPDEDAQIPEGFNLDEDWEIVLKGISCGYRSETPVLRNFDFTAASGELIAVTGPSGSGKTTLLRLLLGLLEPGAGSMLLCDPLGRGYPITAGTRGAFSYVPQGSSMMTGTIRENLGIIAPEATEAQLRQALETACAWDFVKELPGGLDYRLEGGKGLSEGQSQRLAIARALLRRAPILLLDEATSALDETTETKLLDQLRRSPWVRTCILVTHRRKVAESCDRIYHIGLSPDPEVTHDA